MAVRRFKINALIRDKMPEFMAAKKVESFPEAITDPQRRVALLHQKLQEETAEVIAAGSAAALQEEIADVLEVLYTLAAYYEITPAQLEETRLHKKQARGGFDHCLYNPYVELDENNPAITYYIKQPEKYPELALEEDK